MRASLLSTSSYNLYNKMYYTYKVCKYDTMYDVLLIMNSKR